LFGTPAEERGSGKVVLIKAGAYEGVDVSLMHLISAIFFQFSIANTMIDEFISSISGGFIPFLAIRRADVEYFGKAAHAS
ncbi:32820_t:CDS:2, partial [Racocetra persica]